MPGTPYPAGRDPELDHAPGLAAIRADVEARLAGARAELAHLEQLEAAELEADRQRTAVLAGCVCGRPDVDRGPRHRVGCPLAPRDTVAPSRFAGIVHPAQAAPLLELPDRYRPALDLAGFAGAWSSVFGRAATEASDAAAAAAYAERTRDTARHVATAFDVPFAGTFPELATDAELDAYAAERAAHARTLLGRFERLRLELGELVDVLRVGAFEPALEWLAARLPRRRPR